MALADPWNKRNVDEGEAPLRRFSSWGQHTLRVVPERFPVRLEKPEVEHRILGNPTTLGGERPHVNQQGFIHMAPLDGVRVQLVGAFPFVFSVV